MCRLLLIATCLNFISYSSAQIIGGRDNAQMSPRSVEPSKLSGGAVVADVNILNGEYTSSVPLGSVSTPGGLNYGLSVNYSSNTSIGTTAPIASGIPYGEGWNLSVPVISVESEVFRKYLLRQEDFQKQPCGPTGSDGRFVMKYDTPVNASDPVDKFTGKDNGDVYWFAPQLSIPGVVSGRLIFKYYDVNTNTLVFGLNAFESPVEIRMLNTLTSASWTVLLADGTKYWFELMQHAYQAPTNDRVFSYDFCSPSANNAATIANSNTEGSYMLNNVNMEDNMLNNILPKIANSVWYCTKITSNELQNQEIVLSYEAYGKFNFYKEFAPENVANQNGSTGINNAITNSVIGDFSVYRDVLLQKVTSKVDNKNFEIIELDYKTLKSLITYYPNKLIPLETDGSNRMDSLYSYKTIYKQGVTGTSFSNWKRYAHVRAEVPNVSGGLSVNPTNPYLNSSTGMNNYMRNNVPSGSTVEFNDGFLESDRFAYGAENMIPGDVYEVKTKIKNTRGTVDIAVVTGDIGNTPFSSTGEYSTNNMPSSGAYPEASYDKTRGIEIFSTFNMAFKWYRPLQNNVANPYNNELRTSNMFVMPNVPSAYKGFNIQIGPGNADIDYSTPEVALWQVAASTPHFKGKGAYSFMPLATNNPANFLSKSAAPIPHNFGIGYPWGMVVPLFEQREPVSSSDEKSIFANWYYSQAIATQTGSTNRHSPTSLGRQDPNGLVKASLQEVELVRYTKNPYMLQGVRVYRVNNGIGEVLISQKQLEYTHDTKPLIENYDYYDYTNSSIPVKTDVTRSRIVVLLSRVRELPLDATMYAANYGLTDTSKVLTTFFWYTDVNTTTATTNVIEVRGEKIHVLSTIVDHLGGATTVEYKEISNQNVTNNYDPQKSTFPVVNSYSSYGNNTVYTVSITVSKVNKQDAGSLQTWTYTFSNPIKRHNQFLLNTNHFRNAFVQSVDRGYKNVRITKPIISGITAYTDVEHYGTLVSDEGTGTNTDVVLEMMCFGKVKSSKDYMNGIINSEKTSVYAVNTAYEHGAIRPSFSKTHTSYNPDMTSVYLYEDYYLNQSLYTSLSESLDELKTYENSFNYGQVKSERPKMLEGHFYADLLAANGNKAYLFNSNFVKLVSQSSKVYEEGLYKSPIGPLPQPCFDINGNPCNNPVVVIDPVICSYTTSTAQRFVETKKEYSYYEADTKGKTQGTAYHNLFAIDPANPQTINYATYGLGSEVKSNGTIYLKHEPSWQIASVKVTSPQMTGALSSEEYFYFYDLFNRYDRHWYLYDITGNNKFSVQVIGVDTIAVNNIVSTVARANNYSLPRYEGMESTRTHHQRSLAFQKTIASKNASDTYPLVRSEYYHFDNSWTYALTGNYLPVLLRFTSVQIDTIAGTIGGTDFKLRKIDRENTYIADFSAVIASSQPYGKNYVYVLLNPYDHLITKKITERNRLMQPDIVENAQGLKTKYYFNSYVGSNGSMTNLGLLEKITTGYTRTDALTTEIEYTSQGMIKKMKDEIDHSLEYNYDTYLRLIKTTENGTRVLSENTYNLWNHSGLLYFEQRTNQNSQFLNIYNSADPNDKEMIKSFIDPLGREHSSMQAYTDPVAGTLIKRHSPTLVYDNWNRIGKTYKSYDGTGVDMNLNNNSTTAYTEQQFENRLSQRIIKAANYGEDIATTAHPIASEFKLVNGVVAFCELGLTNDEAKVMMRSTGNGGSFYFFRETVTDQDGKQTVTYTNAFGQVAATVSYPVTGTKALTLYGYDSYGNLAKVINPNKQVSTYLYNILGQLVVETTPDAGTRRYMYNKLGQVSVSQDQVQRDRLIYGNPAPQYRVFKYDEYGRPLRVGFMNVYTGGTTYRQPLLYEDLVLYPGPSFIYVFSNASTYDWLCNYRVTSREGLARVNVTPETFETTFMEKSFEYGVTKAAYNLGKLTQENSYNNAGIKILKNNYAYNALGRVASQTTTFSSIDADGSTGLTVSKIDYPAYNYRGSLLEEKVDVNNDNVSDLHLFYTYDRLNRLSAIRGAMGSVLSFQDATLLVSYTYDIDGKLTKKEHRVDDNTALNRLAMEMTYNYDVRDRLTQMEAKNGTTSIAKYNLFYDAQAPISGSQTVLAHQNWNGNINGALMEYNFNTADNVISNFMQTSLYGYQYDMMNRLIKADAYVGDFVTQNPTQGILIGDEEYAYDNIGNITSLKRYLRGMGAAFAETEQWNYNYVSGKNWLGSVTGVGTTASRSYSNDINGNMLTDTYKGISGTVYGRTSYAFTVTKLSGVVDYLYDTKDQRIYKKVDDVDNALDLEEYYLQDISGKTIAIRKIQGGQTGWEYYIHGGEREMSIRPTAQQTPGANSANTLKRVSFAQANAFIYDHLGNTRVSYTAQSWNETQLRCNFSVNYVADYSPYGKILREFVSGEKAKYLTTQHERDTETGLDYRGARYYDSDIARFLSVDPWADKYPAWSTYNYCMGNPLIFVDPTGKGPEWIPIVKNDRLYLQKEEGDNSESLAKFLDVSQETASKLIDNGNNGLVDPGEVHSVWSINNSLQHAKNNPDDYGGYFDNNYDCHESSLALLKGESVDYDNIIEGRELSTELYRSGNYEDVTGNSNYYIFSRTLIRFGNSAGNTEHSATYLGTSNDGTMYTWSKNGNGDKPGVYTVDQLKQTYDAIIQGVGPETGGGFYNLKGGFYNK